MAKFKRSAISNLKELKEKTFKFDTESVIGGIQKDIAALKQQLQQHKENKDKEMNRILSSWFGEIGGKSEPVAFN